MNKTQMQGMILDLEDKLNEANQDHDYWYKEARDFDKENQVLQSRVAELEEQVVDNPCLSLDDEFKQEFLASNLSRISLGQLESLL